MPRTTPRWTYHLERSQLLPLPIDEAFAFFADAGNLEALTPPTLRFRMLTPAPIAMQAGALIDYRLKVHGMPVRWRTEIVAWEPGRRFVDRQLRGPYALWEHTHSFEPVDGGTLMRDVVVYRLPLGPFGALANRLLVAADLRRIFDFRRDAFARLLAPRLDT